MTKIYNFAGLCMFKNYLALLLLVFCFEINLRAMSDSFTKELYSTLPRQYLLDFRKKHKTEINSYDVLLKGLKEFPSDCQRTRILLALHQRQLAVIDGILQVRDGVELDESSRASGLRDEKELFDEMSVMLYSAHDPTGKPISPNKLLGMHIAFNKIFKRLLIGAGVIGLGYWLWRSFKKPRTNLSSV